MPTMRSVIADDEAATREVLTKLLETAGYVVASVPDGQRAIELACRGDVDLLLLPATHFVGAVRMAEKIWRAFAAKEWSSCAGAEPVSCRSGSLFFQSRDVRVKEALLQCADLALARAKRDGMNRTCVFQQHGMVHAPHAYGRSS